MGDEHNAVADDKLLRRRLVLLVAAEGTVVAAVVLESPTGVEQAILFLRRWAGFAALVTAARVGTFESSHMEAEEHILFLRRAGFLGANDSTVAAAAATTTFMVLRRSNFFRLLVFRIESTLFFLLLGCDDEG